MKLADLLAEPLAMAQFSRKSDLTEKALDERAQAAAALQCVDAHALCLEAELNILKDDPVLKDKLDTLNALVADLQAATNVEQHLPADAA